MKKLSTILLYTALVLSGAWLVVLTLGLFNVINLTAVAGKNFNYIAAYIIVIVGLALYILFMFIEKWRKLIVPAWFKNLFYVAFFVFTNVYYFFGLYQTIAGLIVFDVYLACLLNIAAVSLFYNTQKDSKNAVKTTEKFLAFSSFSYAVSGAVIYQVISCLCKVLAKTEGLFASLAMVVTELCIFVFVSLLFALFYALSMKGSRKFVNACLIKYLPASDYKNNKSK